jgi:hypothetical protein
VPVLTPDRRACLFRITNGEAAMPDLSTLLESVWTKISSHLENERERIYEELKNYPRPIPACDAQFNCLLEERTRIADELNRMYEASEQSLNSRDSIKLVEEFIALSRYLNTEAKQRLVSHLKAGLC